MLQKKLFFGEAHWPKRAFGRGHYVLKGAPVVKQLWHLSCFGWLLTTDWRHVHVQVARVQTYAYLHLVWRFKRIGHFLKMWPSFQKDCALGGILLANCDEKGVVWTIVITLEVPSFSGPASFKMQGVVCWNAVCLCESDASFNKMHWTWTCIALDERERDEGRPSKGTK